MKPYNTARTRATWQMTDHTELENQLVSRYGPLMGGESLYRALGYTTVYAFRKAVAEGRLPFVFSLPNARGRFALSTEVARWLYSARSETGEAASNPETVRAKKCR